MKGFETDIEKITLENEKYRKVLYTGQHSQLVLMSLRPNEEIGMEVHEDTDQFFRFEKGQGKCIIDGNEYEVRDGSAIVVPAGARHNVVNTSQHESLKLYTIYSPPHHKDGIVRDTKEEADSNEPNLTVSRLSPSRLLPRRKNDVPGVPPFRLPFTNPYPQAAPNFSVRISAVLGMVLCTG